ncbi:MAG: 4-(cytidine 5'-diphospho)-2-C-methyl-D-erythritol kinase [Candidatus Woesearchaeota archaeon]|nr:4-(cytidine 5'-diphospho)-2-C-methyl-D-erythritol kinase [Candidatus Woesearchaeota archaeon]
MAVESLEIKAFAKINLSFEIMGKLPSGNHEISSVFQSVGLFDYLKISKIREGYELSGSVLCNPEDNLATKAKQTLEYYVESELPCSIELTKSIPVSSGLGGGSSDAASVLIGLNELYKIGLSQEELLAISSEIGSDVPFFVRNSGTALVSGAGEKVSPADCSHFPYYVLARPHKRLSAKKMYELYDETGKSFFELANEMCPKIGELYVFFSTISKQCGMSGSGPTVFAGFENYKEAEKQVSDFGIEHFDGDFFICRALDRTYEIARRT